MTPTLQYRPRPISTAYEPHGDISSADTGATGTTVGTLRKVPGNGLLHAVQMGVRSRKSLAHEESQFVRESPRNAEIMSEINKLRGIRDVDVS
jgi:hypothetical protein